MDILNFDELYQFAEFFYDIADSGDTATAVLLYEDAKDLMLLLSEMDDVSLENVHLESEDYNGYNKEFYVTLSPEFELFIEPVYDDEIIKECYSDSIFYFGDTNSRIAIENDCDNKYEVDFDDESNDCENCCDDCCSCRKKETNEALMAALDFLDYLLS